MKMAERLGFVRLRFVVANSRRYAEGGRTHAMVAGTLRARESGVEKSITSRIIASPAQEMLSARRSTVARVKHAPVPQAA
jgi:hypothetical protein